MKSIDSYIQRYDKLQEAIINSSIYKEALESFKTGLKDFSFTPQEQANAYASFIAQVTLGLQAQSMEMALRLELSEIQAEDLKIKSALEAQILKSQALSSSFEVQKGEAMIQASRASALQEKIKCEVLIKSANDNTQINKANTLVEYMSALGNSQNPQRIDESNIHQNIKDSILNIGENGSIKNISEETYNWLSDINIQVLIYTSKTNLSIDEIGLFGVISNVEYDSLQWDFEGEIIEDSEIINYAFSTSGYKNIKVTLKSKDKSYSDSVVVLVN